MNILGRRSHSVWSVRAPRGGNWCRWCHFETENVSAFVSAFKTAPEASQTAQSSGSAHGSFQAVRLLWWEAAVGEEEAADRRWTASIHHLVDFSEKGFCRGEPTVRLPQSSYTASVICHSFDTKTAKYFLLVCNHVSLLSPVSWQPNITPQAKRTEIQYYKPSSPSSLPNYHPSPWKPFGWVSNHSNLHLRCSKTCSPWRRRGERVCMEMGLRVLCVCVCMKRVCRYLSLWKSVFDINLHLSGCALHTHPPPVQSGPVHREATSLPALTPWNQEPAPQNTAAQSRLLSTAT